MSRQQINTLIDIYWQAFRETGNVNFYLRAKRLERL